MDIRVETEASQNLHEEKFPLLVDSFLPETVEKTLIQQAISQTFQSTAHLANLLPTGSVLAFQLLSPIFTSQGDCDAVGQYLTAGLIALCGLSCFLLSFTDSFKDQMGAGGEGKRIFMGAERVHSDTTLTGKFMREIAKGMRMSSYNARIPFN
ncbi:hypothetical protein RJ640_021518 [Escallonia rubra]|uniref:Uncharacterized protein n=1 Tax=Escallonia rubra TaxID=112253 RepID=A0AA88U059_9ASTE|nr:hypothetical protein RJ640_021518 [Escallonia rubra]